MLLVDDVVHRNIDDTCQTTYYMMYDLNYNVKLHII